MLIELVVLALGIPVGFLIAWLARDELVQGRKYFRILIISSIIGVIGFWIYGRPVEAWTSGFIGIVAFVSFIKTK